MFSIYWSPEFCLGQAHMLPTSGPGILASADSPVPGGGEGTGKISAPFPDIGIGTSVSPNLPFPLTYLFCPHRRLGVSSGA